MKKACIVSLILDFVFAKLFIQALENAYLVKFRFNCTHEFNENLYPTIFTNPEYFKIKKVMFVDGQFTRTYSFTFYITFVM